tara:strand:- start:40458 stop:40988 length:531 start_codon:yes stop_codon:yes gene_type:complete
MNSGGSLHHHWKNSQNSWRTAVGMKRAIAEFMTERVNEDIEELNSFLRGERSAVETYNQCIYKLDNAQIAKQLQTLKTSHLERVKRLTEEIAKRGGEPQTDSGVWGSFAKIIEGGASILGEKAALSVLVEGEDHGLNDYRDTMNDLSLEARKLVAGYLLPEQMRTREALGTVKSSM